MKLYQLAPDHKEYGEKAGWWLVVSDDLETELAGPFPTMEEAEKCRASMVTSQTLGGAAK